MANRHMRSCTMSWIIRVMEIKTTIRYNLSPARMAIINKSINNKCWWRCRLKGTLVHHCWECRLVKPLWKAIWSYLKKIKDGTSLWPSDSTSGGISKETWNTDSKENMHPYVHCSLIYSSQDLEAAQVSIIRWVDKNAVVYLHNGILLGHKKEKSYPLW